MSDPQTVPEVLRATADYLEGAGWERTFTAVDAARQPIAWDSPLAVARCTLGAMSWVCRANRPPAYAAKDALERHLRTNNIGLWNDAQPSVGPILAALRAAADAEEAHVSPLKALENTP